MRAAVAGADGGAHGSPAAGHPDPQLRGTAVQAPAVPLGQGQAHASSEPQAATAPGEAQVSNTTQSSADHARRERLILEVKRAAGPFILFVFLVVAGLLTGADIVRNLAGDKPWLSYQPYRVAVTDAKGIVPGR